MMLLAAILWTFAGVFIGFAAAKSVYEQPATTVKYECPSGPVGRPPTVR